MFSVSIGKTFSYILHCTNTHTLSLLNVLCRLAGFGRFCCLSPCCMCPLPSSLTLTCSLLHSHSPCLYLFSQINLHLYHLSSSFCFHTWLWPGQIVWDCVHCWSNSVNSIHTYYTKAISISSSLLVARSYAPFCLLLSLLFILAAWIGELNRLWV